MTTILVDGHGILDDVAVPFRSRFVAREAELARLRELRARAGSGDSAVALVGGEAGVGKSRLAEEVGAAARAGGALVLRGECVELGGEGLPFAPFVAILRDLLRQRPEALGGAADELAGLLLPELGVPGADRAAGHGRMRLFDLVVALVEQLAADRPVLLVIEDLHWADRSTRDLVGYLARALRAAPVTLLCTYRSDELHRGHPLRPYLAELARVRGVERIDLDRLDRAGTRGVLAGILAAEPSRALLDSVHDRSQGNPFFIEELVAASGGDRYRSCDLPETLRDLLLARADRLSEPDQRVLRIAAAGGNRIAHRLLAQVADVPEAELEASLRAAVAAQLVVVDPDADSYEFRHALVCEVLHDELLPGEHVRLHARYAAAIEADPGLVDPTRAPAETAHHWYAAHDHPRALAAAVRASRSAGRRYAYAEERRLLERALELWDQVPDAEERAGMDHLTTLESALSAARAAGDYERAKKLAGAALSEVDRDAEPARAAHLLVVQSRLSRSLGHGAAIAKLEEARRLTDRAPLRADQADILIELATCADIGGSLDMVTWTLDRSTALAAAVDDPAVRFTHALVSSMTRQRLESPEAGLDQARRAVELAHETDDKGAAFAHIMLSDLLQELGRYAESAETAERGLAYAHRSGLGRTRGVILRANYAEALLALGRWDLADEQCAEIAELDPPGTAPVLGLMQRAWTGLSRGDATAAVTLTAALGYAARRYLSPSERVGLHELRIAGALAGLPTDPDAPDAPDAPDGGDGPDLPAAVAATVAALDDEDLPDQPRYAWPALVQAARTAAIAGDPALAGRVGALAAALPVRYPPERAAAAEVAARLATGGDALPAWRAAVDARRADGRPGVLARVLLGLAEAAGATDRECAERAVTEAAATADRLGAEPLRRQAALLARRLGLRTATAATGTAPAGLTDRELEVLRLVADGRSNRDIALALYISPKTASVHVSHIIAKLSVSRRGEAAAVARRLGLLTGPTGAANG